MIETALDFIAKGVPLVLAITLHEAAHGWAALRLGDDTAWRLGRVTFNPLRHIDPFGTIVLPGMLFLASAPFIIGFAKPVPVNFFRLHRPRRDMVLVALAGPGINLAQAVFAAWLIRAVDLLPTPVADWSFEVLRFAVLINVVLAVFNLLPLPPLDGGRVLTGLLPAGPARFLMRVERFGLFILLALVIIVPMVGRYRGVELNPAEWLLGPPVNLLVDLIGWMTGLD
ncbi:MAG: site-2 protease family protein [Alphaproteobacteria bacterium]|nr:site-2 protease family protein [Alphaproteobacteria bacterium]